MNDFWSYINIHSHQTTPIKEDIALYNHSVKLNLNPLIGSAGMHPCYIKANFQSDFEILNQLWQCPKILAIGECGLDKYSHSTLETQIEVFEEHIKASIKYNKPLIIHLVGHYDEFFKLKKKYKNSPLWIIHGFQKNVALGNQLYQAGCILSFGKAILKKSYLKTLLLNHKKFYLETDDDTSINIAEIYLEVSKILGIDLSELKSTIYQNFKKDFLCS